MVLISVYISVDSLHYSYEQFQEVETVLHEWLIARFSLLLERFATMLFLNNGKISDMFFE